MVAEEIVLFGLVKFSILRDQLLIHFYKSSQNQAQGGNVMWFVLFLDLNNLEYYGYIPEIPKDREGRVEIYRFDVTREHWDLLLDDFIDPVCNLCEALIDIGDVDFLNADKCKKLKGWLEKRLQRDVPETFKPIYEKLLEFSSRAIELNTGVEIEL